jgi:hypothetical protein
MFLKGMIFMKEKKDIFKLILLSDSQLDKLTDLVSQSLIELIEPSDLNLITNNNIYWVYTFRSVLITNGLKPELIHHKSNAGQRKRKLFSKVKKQELGIPLKRKLHKEVNPYKLSKKQNYPVSVLYFDASFKSTQDCYIGYVKLDQNNKIVKERGLKVHDCNDAFEAECKALLTLLEDIHKTGEFDKLYIIYGDAKSVIEAVIGHEKNNKCYLMIAEINYYLSYIKFELKWIPRYQNYYADYVCQLAKIKHGYYDSIGGDFTKKRKELVLELTSTNNKALGPTREKGKRMINLPK